MTETIENLVGVFLRPVTYCVTYQRAQPRSGLGCNFSWVIGLHDHIENNSLWVSNKLACTCRAVSRKCPFPPARSHLRFGRNGAFAKPGPLAFRRRVLGFILGVIWGVGF